MQDTKLSLKQASAIGHVSGQGIVYIQDDVLINKLELEPGSSIIIQSTKTLTLTDEVALQSTTLSPVTIQNEGINNGAISIAGNYRLCTDNLSITNVDFIGTSVFAVGSSTITNSTGWLPVTCDNLLFADFTFQYNCEGSYLYLTSTSLGGVENIRWLINGVELSSEEVVYYKIQNTENLLVRLEASKGELIDSYEIEIPIRANPLNANHLVVSGNRLYSFEQSSAYQWLLNDTIIAGEVQRFTIYTAQAGNYSVLTFNEACNRESDKYIITSTENSLSVKSVKPFPNPTNSIVYFSTEQLIVSVYAQDMTGRVFPVEFSLSNDLYGINLLPLANGIYNLKFFTETNRLAGQAKILKKD